MSLPQQAVARSKDSGGRAKERPPARVGSHHQWDDGSVVGRCHGWHMAGLQEEIGDDPEVRLCPMSLGKEEVQFVGFPIGQTQAVQIDGLVDCRVHATDINDQLAVHENPDVIIAGE